MSEEEAIHKLEEMRKQREDAYKKFEGFVEGIRAGRQLSTTDEGFLQLLEFMIKGFKNVWNEVITSFELQFVTIKRFNNIETRMSKIEENLLQLRQTLDKMTQDR